MAQQAILAAHRRRRKDKEDKAEGLGGGKSSAVFKEADMSANILQLRRELKAKSSQLYKLFSIWDEDGDGSIDEREFARAMRMLGLQPAKEDFSSFCSLFPGGEIRLEELTVLIESTPAETVAKEEPKPRSRNPLLRLFSGLYWLVGTEGSQTILYFAFVVIFNTLTSTLRLKEEYYLDKQFSDTFVENAFDEHHNIFENIRRVADVWEWGNTVLWPGLFGNSGPACGEVGVGGAFNSAVDAAGSVNATEGLPPGFRNGCIDHTWPDGGGTFHHDDASAFTVDELVVRFNELDWTEGILIWQTRVAQLEETFCKTRTIGNRCYPSISDELLASSLAEVENTSPFGHNWTHPGSALDHPFRYYTPVETGGVPYGPHSAHPASLQAYPAGGFVAILIPFFSDTFLPDQKGDSQSVLDFRLYRAARHTERTPRYFCVRLVWDGDFMHQLCDPNDEVTGRTTGVVRAAVEEFWNDLKRARFVDHATRAMTITVPLSSNFVGVRSRVTFMFEFMATGSVLPSYDSQTRVERKDLMEATSLYCWVAFCFTVFFSLLEIVEIASDGPVAYFGNMWNVMDWLNYVIFFVVWSTLNDFLAQAEQETCSELCLRTGYHDDWRVMSTIRDGKFYLSLCVCIQLLKIIKFTSSMVPKMGLAPQVLKKALPDLVFFSAVFFITLFAFSSLFFIQLGPFMAMYATQEGSIVALGRALFGDFDIDAIMDNSPSYMNTLLFLLYLFVAVFIMLSMFFAILGESQANLRDEERSAKIDGGEAEPEYGIFAHAADFLAERVLLNAPLIGPRLRLRRARIRMEEVKQEQSAEASPVERIEARQLELSDNVADLSAALLQLREAVAAVGTKLEQRGGGAHTANGLTANGGAGPAGGAMDSRTGATLEATVRRLEATTSCLQQQHAAAMEAMKHAGERRIPPQLPSHAADKDAHRRASKTGPGRDYYAHGHSGGGEGRRTWTTTPPPHVERPRSSRPPAAAEPRAGADRDRPLRESRYRERDGNGAHQLRERERGGGGGSSAKLVEERSPNRASRGNPNLHA